jgi:hypothetical protein
MLMGLQGDVVLSHGAVTRGVPPAPQRWHRRLPWTAVFHDSGGSTSVGDNQGCRICILS